VVSAALGACGSSVSPSEETLTFVIDVGSALPLLDLRVVRNLVGASSFGFFAFSPGSSPVDFLLTLMLSLAVLTMAGALERQLPDPLSHRFFGVWVPVVVGVDAPSDAVLVVDDARELFDSALGGASPSLGTVDAVVLSAMPASAGGTSGPVPPAGAWEFGFDFLRGLIRAGREGGERTRGPLYCVAARAVHVRSEACLQARGGRAGCLLAINHDACACPVLSGEPSATYARFCHRPAGESTKFIHPRTFCPHSTAPPTANMAIQKKVRIDAESLR
jgi:hypothetical protein